MSIHSEPATPVANMTARVARAAFSRGTTWLAPRDTDGSVYNDASIAPLFALRGRPEETPWRLALATVMRFAEGLWDRRAADAVRAR